MCFDVVVIGGGPAGAVTALVLARLGRSVAVLEATGFDAPRYGETFPPEITPLLKRLGLWHGFLATRPLESPGTISVWGVSEPQEQDFVRNVHGCGWHVDRVLFDKMMWQRAGQEGARLFPDVRAAKWRQEGEGWEISDVHCRFLVDARGRTSMREVSDLLVAVAVRLEDPHAQPSDLRTIVESVPEGWWYSAPLPDGTILAMFFTDRETYGDGISLGEQLQEAHSTCKRIGPARIAKSQVLRVPCGIRAQIATANWLAVGDAAACHDPLSGRGVFQAIRQGARAAEAIHRALEGDATDWERYEENVRREFSEYEVQRRSYYASETRWRNHGFWRRRLGGRPLDTLDAAE